MHFNHDGWATDEGPLPISALTWGQLMGSLKAFVETSTAGAAVPQGVVLGPHRMERPSASSPSLSFDMNQQPAASVPFGFTSSGLPVGLQIVGRATPTRSC